MMFDSLEKYIFRKRIVLLFDPRHYVASGQHTQSRLLVQLTKILKFPIFNYILKSL